MDLYPAFLLLLLALAAQSQPLIGDKPVNKQGDQSNGADNGSNGGMRSGDQITVDCPPGSSMASSCSGTHCVVACGNGKKVRQ